MYVIRHLNVYWETYEKLCLCRKDWCPVKHEWNSIRKYVDIVDKKICEPRNRFKWSAARSVIANKIGTLNYFTVLKDSKTRLPWFTANNDWFLQEISVNIIGCIDLNKKFYFIFYIQNVNYYNVLVIYYIFIFYIVIVRFWSTY